MRRTELYAPFAGAPQITMGALVGRKQHPALTSTDLEQEIGRCLRVSSWGKEPRSVRRCMSALESCRGHGGVGPAGRANAKSRWFRSSHVEYQLVIAKDFVGGMARARRCCA